MKKRTLLTCGLAAALFAGCSSDDKLTVDDGTVSNGTGYVSLRIALPSTSSGMRADNQANDQYDEGVANEYKVNDVTLVFFNGDKEVLSTHKLAGFSETATDNKDGITVEYTLATQKVSGNAEYVLVLLNKPAALETDVATFDQLNKAIDCADVTKLTGGSYDNFFMSNTTLWNVTTSKSQTLVPIVPQTTIAKAEANKAIVYVERAVGKVELSHYAEPDTKWSGWTYTIPAGAAVYAEDKITINKWNVDLTNKKTYPVRKYNDDWSSINGRNGKRMFSTGNAYASDGSWQRTYWAEDPNYNVDEPSDPASRQLKDNTTFSPITTTKLYCPENTFDVLRMKQKNSTRVLLEATYRPNNIPDSEIGDGTWYLLGNSSTPKSSSTIIALANEAIGGPSPVVKKLAFTKGVKLTAELQTTNFLKDGDTPVTDAELTLIKNAIKPSITTYEKGVCYYAVRIQHFGSYYTPWGSETGAPTVGTDAFYNYTTTHADNDKNYLGRYGIVRNNWYQLMLNSISAPGEPTIPTPTDSPDDVTNYYISATVKIMDWAVRKQSVDL